MSFPFAPNVNLASMSKGPLRGAEAVAAVEQAPEGRLAQVVDGVLYTFPRPRIRHSVAASHLGGWLFDPFGRGIGGPGGWIILDEPELHLGPGPDIVVPDLAGYRRETAPEIDDPTFLDVAPDWVCEVLSPATAELDRGDKLEVWAREGVTHLWFLDPAERTLEALVRDGASFRELGRWTERADVTAPPFAAKALPLALLWEP